MELKDTSEGNTPTSLASLQSLLPLHCSVLQGKMRLCSHYVPLIPSVQILSIVEHSIHLRTLNLWMNGPRVHWARGLQLVFQLFIIFNKGEIFQGDEALDQENPQDKTGLDYGLYYVASISSFTAASHMAVEQLLLLRLSNANKGSAQEFVELPPGNRLRQYGMNRVDLFLELILGDCFLLRKTVATINCGPGVSCFLFCICGDNAEVLRHSSLRLPHLSRHLYGCPLE